MECTSCSIEGMGEGEHNGSLTTGTGRTKTKHLFKMEKGNCILIPLSTKFLLGKKKNESKKKLRAGKCYHNCLVFLAS